MIATTTENPSFSVTRQLLSRLHVLRLRQLGRPELLRTRQARRGGPFRHPERRDPVISFRRRPTATPGPCSTWWSTPRPCRRRNATCPTSRPPCPRSWPATTRMGTAITNTPQRSSNRSAAAIPTRRCTIWPACSKAAKIRVSSAAGSSCPPPKTWGWPIRRPCRWPSPASRPWSLWGCPKATSRCRKPWSTLPLRARAIPPTRPTPTRRGR